MLLFAETLLLTIFSGLAATGYGSGLSSILDIEPNIGDQGILGLLCLGILGCLFHFAMPLTPFAQSAILVGGIAVWFISRRKLGNPRIAWLSATIVFIFSLSHRQAILNPDAGLYHLQTTRWLREQPIVAGLGNLHGRLAFNSMLFPIDAVTDRSGIGWIPNFLLISFILYSLITRLRTITSTSPIHGRSSVIEVGMIVPSVMILSEGWYGVLNADAFASVLVIYSTCLAIGLPTSLKLQTDSAAIIFSALLAAVVKLSAGPMLLTAIAVTWINRKYLSSTFVYRTSLIAGLALLVWLFRGILLSGCAVYPVVQTCISDLPWAESKHLVTAESLAIRSWARAPGDLNFAKVLSDHTWFIPWVKRTWLGPSVLLLAIFCPLGLTTSIIRRNVEGQAARSLIVTAVGLFGGLIFWFVSAPDVRFGKGFILAAAVLGGAVAFSTFSNRLPLAALIPPVLMVGMAVLSLRAVGRRTSDYSYSVPEASTFQFKAPNGNVVYVPKVPDKCWDHKLPCTPYFDPIALKRISWPAKWPSPASGWIPDAPPTSLIKNVSGE